MKLDISHAVIREVQLDVDINSMIDYRLSYLTELQGEMTTEYKKGLSNELFNYISSSIKNGSFYALLLEYEGIIISFGAMVFKRIPGDINQYMYLEADILNMYTLPAYRNMGASSIVLENLITKAKGLRVSKLSLHTSKAGEKLYRKYGFAEPIYPVLECPCQTAI